MSQAHKHPEYLKNRGVILREQPICTVCNRQPSTQADHIIPIDAGGGHDITNLRGICAKCNNTLAHRYVTQRNQTRQTIRADAMRDNGIIDITNETKTTKKTEKTKPFFTEKKYSPRPKSGLSRIALTSLNWQVLVVSSRDLRRCGLSMPGRSLTVLGIGLGSF